MGREWKADNFCLTALFCCKESVILTLSEGTDGTEQEKATEFGCLRKRPVYQDDISNMDSEGNGRRIRLTAGRMFAGQDDTRTTSG
ncbi:hypothetical protein EDI28_22310 [Photobacterium chitinilyticum]|uniref:Uncharacterized protein n=1 Tax=Photobacterium chitinilyticum TaxID=2485123 RepID=A0A444JJX1_9GAMM|nr:hypothetical protein EDI28_22310 [Photobacterium chitinilyticum]